MSKFKWKFSKRFSSLCKATKGHKALSNMLGIETDKGMVNSFSFNISPKILVKQKFFDVSLKWGRSRFNCMNYFE